MARLRRYPGPETPGQDLRSCKTLPGCPALVTDSGGVDGEVSGQSASKFKINLFYADGQSGSGGQVQLYLDCGHRPEQSDLSSSAARQRMQGLSSVLG